jgi:hypothetical protein
MFQGPARDPCKIPVESSILSVSITEGNMTNPYWFDPELEVGDYITSYHAGIFRLRMIQRRFMDESYVRMKPECKVGDEYNPMFHYEKVLDRNFKPVKSGKIDSCDASFCRKVTRDTLQQEKQEAIARFDGAIKQLFGD